MSASSINYHHSVNGAHQRSQITSLMVNPYSPKELITVGHDGYIRTWSYPDFSITRQVRFRTPYLTFLTPFKGDFLLAMGNGNVLRLNKNFETESSMLLHDDCVSYICTGENSVITTGYDGRVCFLNKETLALENCLQLETPLTQCAIHQNHLYVAGTESYKINLSTNTVEPIGRFSQFIVYNNEVLGCSDEKGITFLRNNKNTYVPAQYLISMGRDLLFMAEGTLGVMSIQNDEEVSWEIFKTPFFKKSYSILSGLCFEDSIILAGECSNIYHFKKQSLMKNFVEIQ